MSHNYIIQKYIFLTYSPFEMAASFLPRIEYKTIWGLGKGSFKAITAPSLFN